ncbi:MAG: hypothetical protein JOY60_10950 [Burkholderiaceae bacterium]|nr:hypothetical protein [Burkholderiaceae bacterium]
MSSGKPSIVLNVQNNTWRIYVNGVNKTEAVGLAVDPLGKSLDENIQVKITRPDDLFHGTFLLQYALLGGYACTGECPAGQKSWKQIRP